jgi:hypothetical protein
MQNKLRPDYFYINSSNYNNTHDNETNSHNETSHGEEHEAHAGKHVSPTVIALFFLFVALIIGGLLK